MFVCITWKKKISLLEHSVVITVNFWTAKFLCRYEPKGRGRGHSDKMSIETDPNSIFNCPQTMSHLLKRGSSLCFHKVMLLSTWAQGKAEGRDLCVLYLWSGISYVGGLKSEKGHRRDWASGNRTAVCSEIKWGMEEAKITDETNVGWWSCSKLSWKWDHGFLLPAVVHYYWPLSRPIRMCNSHVGGAITPAHEWTNTSENKYCKGQICPRIVSLIWHIWTQHSIESVTLFNKALFVNIS